MSSRAPPYFYVASIAVHICLAVALLRVHVPVQSDPVVITLTSYTPPPPKPPPLVKAPKPVPEAAPAPKPAPAPHVAKPAAPRVAVAKTAPPPPTAAPPPAAPAAAPDFGVQLGGGSGPGGIAVAVGDPGGGPTSVRHAASKILTAAAPATNGCTEPPTKPHLLNMPQPVFPSEARAAGIQGKVRVRITVDASGAVADAKVIEGLGHGCDEAALEAARTCRFDPALRCGAPVAGSITMGFTF